MRRTDIRVNVDLASLPGPHAFLNGLGCRFTGVAVLVLMLRSKPTLAKPTLATVTE